MASASLPQQTTLARNFSGAGRHFASTVVAMVALGCIVVAALHPVGYVGGGVDDMRYLAGVECLVHHGFCLPTNHWEARFPFVYPAAIAVQIFGESREALWVVPLLFSVAAVSLFGLSVAEACGRRAGMFAALIFLLCAEVANHLLDFAVDLPEFTFLVAGVWCLLRKKGLAAGISFGLAVLCRPTVVALAPFVAAYLIFGKRLDLLIATSAVAATVLISEAVIMGALSGDPFLTWRLALHHNVIPSSYLEWKPFRGNPLFNMDLVAAWPPAAKIDVPWQLRPIVNFVGFPTLVVLHATTLVALLLAKDRRLNWLALCAAGYFIIVAYGFAIDPKPRMFLPVIAAECAIIAQYVTRPIGPARLLGAMCVGGLAFVCIFTSFDRPDLRRAAHTAADWLKSDPSLKVENTVSTLLEVRGLRREVYQGGRGRFVAFVRHSCRIGIAESGLSPKTVTEREQSVQIAEPVFVARLRSMRLFLERPSSDQVCIFAVRE